MKGKLAEYGIGGGAIGMAFLLFKQASSIEGIGATGIMITQIAAVALAVAAMWVGQKRKPPETPPKPQPKPPN